MHFPAFLSRPMVQGLEIRCHAPHVPSRIPINDQHLHVLARTIFSPFHFIAPTSSFLPSKEVQNADENINKDKLQKSLKDQEWS